jgi:hypothetical protein
MTATYNRAVTSRPLSLDTSPEIERLQIEGWRRMSPADKAGLVRALTVATIEMTKAGIRHRHPDESAEQHRMRLAEILLGPDLARRAFSGACRSTFTTNAVFALENVAAVRRR